MAALCNLAECLRYFDDAIVVLDRGFRSIEAEMPKPRFVVRGKIKELRYQNQTVEVALFLKLARAISLLAALRMIVEKGRIQEQGILARAIDETDEDLFFLTQGHQNGIEPIHELFLRNFWEVEFPESGNMGEYRRRESIPRRKIQAYNSKFLGEDISTIQHVARTLHGVFSGFVHGPAVHTLELYDVETQRFCLLGACPPAVRQAYVNDAANYPYRVMMSAVMVARRLGFKEAAEGFYLQLKSMEAFIGMPSEKEAADLQSKLRKR